VNTSDLIRRYLVVKADARRSRDHWIRTKDPLWLEISMIERQLMRALHTAILHRVRGFKTPR
jgi:hypothetical protein